MKYPRKDSKTRTTRHKSSGRGSRSREDEQITEMLKLCLQKVCELQADMERTEDAQDPEAAGYAACAMETLRFLSSQGLSPDHPIVKRLTEKLINNRQ